MNKLRKIRSFEFIFKFLDFKIVYIIFNNNKKNDVKLKIVFFRKYEIK